MGASKLKIAAMKIVTLRPKRRFKGSDIQAALKGEVSRQSFSLETGPSFEGGRRSYKNAIAIYGIAFTSPTIQEFFSHVPAAVHASPESGIPNAVGNERLAPLEPGDSHDFNK